MAHSRAVAVSSDSQGTGDDTDKSSNWPDMIQEPTSAFESLERDFNEVLNELVGDRSLDRFRLEYEKLHRALKRSHESEKRVITKCRELNAEIVSNAAKVQTALRLSQEDQNTITSLKRELEKAWGMVDVSQQTERKAKETITDLKKEIQNLSKIVEHGSGLVHGDDNNVQMLIKQNSELLQDRDALNRLVTKLQADISTLVEGREDSMRESNKQSRAIEALRDQLGAERREKEKERRRMERTEKELNDAHTNLSDKRAELSRRDKMIEELEQKVQRGDVQLKQQKDLTDKAGADIELLRERLDKSRSEYEDQVSHNQQLLAENSQGQIEIKFLREELVSQRNDMMRQTRALDGMRKRYKQLEEAKTEVEKRDEAKQSEIAGLQREVEKLEKIIVSDKKQILVLQRERDLLNKNLLKSADETQGQVEQVQMQIHSKKTLEKEIGHYRDEAQKQRAIIQKLEIQCERAKQAESEATNRYMREAEEVKMAKVVVEDMEKRVRSAENSIKEQKKRQEKMRAERNLLSKSLAAVQDESNELRRKFRIMDHQIEQMKDEITVKDQALVKEHFTSMKLNKDLAAVRNELRLQTLQNREAEASLASQKQEILKLNQIINEADIERRTARKEYEMALNERDIFGTQLIRRNDELALVHEKVKIQQSILEKGEKQYQRRLEDVRLLRLEIKELKRVLQYERSNKTNVETLQNHIPKLEADLIAEKNKVKALSEELENPVNVHRWRKLEGSDPDKLDMIRKIQMLQKRLISKTNEAVEKEMELSERTKLYNELKQILARQPGPELAEQLSFFKNKVAEKNRAMRAIVAELNMAQVQINEFRFQLEKTSRECTTMKKIYYQEKKKRMLRSDQAWSGSMAIVPTKQRSASTSGVMLGGGFRLNTTTSA